MVQAGDIFLISDQKLGDCSDRRPWLVLEVFSHSARVCSLSAQFDMAEGCEISILKSDSEFVESGLRKNSYIPEVPNAEISLDKIEKSKRIGRATGEFKRKVEAFFGLSF